MLISHEHRFIYIKTRKTAGTSLEISLAGYMGPNDVIAPFKVGADEELRQQLAGKGAQNYDVPRNRWRVRDQVRAIGGKPPRYSEHSPAYVVHRYLSSDEWDTYYKFTVERNPWELAVSAYHWYHRKAPERTSFAEFVFSDALAHYSNWRLYTIKGKVVVDRVYRYDELPEVLDDLSRRFSLPSKLELPRAKGTYRRDRRPYWEFYDEPERQRVGLVFQREIAHFGWRFGG